MRSHIPNDDGCSDCHHAPVVEAGDAVDLSDLGSDTQLRDERLRGGIVTAPDLDGSLPARCHSKPLYLNQGRFAQLIFWSMTLGGAEAL